LPARPGGCRGWGGGPENDVVPFADHRRPIRVAAELRNLRGGPGRLRRFDRRARLSFQRPRSREAPEQMPGLPAGESPIEKGNEGRLIGAAGPYYAAPGPDWRRKGCRRQAGPRPTISAGKPARGGQQRRGWMCRWEASTWSVLRQTVRDATVDESSTEHVCVSEWRKHLFGRPLDRTSTR